MGLALAGAVLRPESRMSHFCDTQNCEMRSCDTGRASEAKPLQGRVLGWWTRLLRHVLHHFEVIDGLPVIKEQLLSPWLLAFSDDLFDTVAHDSCLANPGSYGIKSSFQFIQLTTIECLCSEFVPAPGAQIGQMQLRHFPRRLFQNQTTAMLYLPSRPGNADVQDGPHLEFLTIMTLHFVNQLVVTAKCGVSGFEPLGFVNEKFGLRRCRACPDP